MLSTLSRLISLMLSSSSSSLCMRGCSTELAISYVKIKELGVAYREWTITSWMVTETDTRAEDVLAAQMEGARRRN
jgi:hypothetical protein